MTLALLISKRFVVYTILNACVCMYVCTCLKYSMNSFILTIIELIASSFFSTYSHYSVVVVIIIIIVIFIVVLYNNNKIIIYFIIPILLSLHLK